jgi:small subunit ribosomal protein S1
MVPGRRVDDFLSVFRGTAPAEKGTLMLEHEILSYIGLTEDDLAKLVNEAMGDKTEEELKVLYESSIQLFEVDCILRGRIVNVIGDEVVVDVGYKSEGVISKNEFDDPDEIDPGDAIEVLLEEVEDEAGMLKLSKRKADRIRGWEHIITEKAEGDTVKGKVIRKIKGGLLVDIGVPVFLPASQVSIRRTGDISEYIGRDVECEIIKIDRQRMNIVVSRRRIIERAREEQKKKLLAEIQEGEIRRGQVKNLADFGAFIDLGGIDGLLHITDMSWGRINHPSEILNIDDEVEVKILKVDKERERIALGLKQKSESPWKDVDVKYPIGTRARGTVVNVMSYGAFVKLEEGIEGLVHISEMSWTRRVNHPSEIVNIDDTVDIVVLDINQEKQEISLGMKQTEINPWSLVEQNYPPNTLVEGKVRNLTNYGAFIEIEEGIDGLLHISDMSWTKKISHPSELIKKGDLIKTVVLSVDQNRKRVALGLKQLDSDPWEEQIPMRFHSGDQVRGKVTKLTNFGAFVELEDNLEGLLHISELSEDKVKNPEDVVKVGDTVDVRILRVDATDRKIGLTLIGMLDENGEVTPVTLTHETESSTAPEAAPTDDATEEAEAAPTEDATEEAEASPTEDATAPEAEAAPTEDATTSEVEAPPTEEVEETSESTEEAPAEAATEEPGADAEATDTDPVPADGPEDPA